MASIIGPPLPTSAQRRVPVLLLLARLGERNRTRNASQLAATMAAVADTAVRVHWRLHCSNSRPPTPQSGVRLGAPPASSVSCSAPMLKVRGHSSCSIHNAYDPTPTKLPLPPVPTRQELAEVIHTVRVATMNVLDAHTDFITRKLHTIIKQHFKLSKGAREKHWIADDTWSLVLQRQGIHTDLRANSKELNLTRMRIAFDTWCHSPPDRDRDAPRSLQPFFVKNAKLHKLMSDSALPLRKLLKHDRAAQKVRLVDAAAAATAAGTNASAACEENHHKSRRRSSKPMAPRSRPPTSSQPDGKSTLPDW